MGEESRDGGGLRGAEVVGARGGALRVTVLVCDDITAGVVTPEESRVP